MSSTDTDLTGRDSMVRNVLASWGGHLVFVVAGFVMPRLIDGYAGQEALGVWDFGWSLVAYFILVQGGIVSSINRYVAKYRAVGDIEGVNRAISSVTFVLLLMGVLVVLLTAGATIAVPALFSQQLGAFVQDAQWVVLLLGLGIAVEIVFSGFGGVVTGCHRWDLHNAIHAGSHLVTVAGMIGALVLGFGLPALALMSLLGEIGGRVVRCVYAYKVCPGLSVRYSRVRWSEAREMISFGGKAFIPHIGELLLNQTTSILILAFMGPASLALFSRPVALIRHVRTLVSRFSFILTPTASSLQALDNKEHLRAFLVDSARWGAYVTLPLALPLAILGGPLLQLWMGTAYGQAGMVLAILALGRIAPIAQTTVMSVLTGMNLHGRPGLAQFIAAVCALGLSILALSTLQWGLVGAALAVTIPQTLASGIYVTMYACRQVELPLLRYLSASLKGPLLCSVPYMLALAGGRIAFSGQPMLALVCGGGLGTMVIALIYWRYVLPDSLKERVAGRIVPQRFRGGLESA